MTKPNPYLWPPFVEITFRDGRGKVKLTSKDRKLDFSDSLMLHHVASSRTVYLGMKTSSPKWTCWTEERVLAIEKLIRYDLQFDVYSVRINRLDIPSEQFACSEEFHWKLVIRAS